MDFALTDEQRQLQRRCREDGALAPIQPPPADFCLFHVGLYELGLDPADLPPPLKLEPT